MGLGIFILGLVVFFATHLFTTFRGARADAIAKLGLNGYRALFALVSIAGLALIVWGFGQYHAHAPQIWSPPAFMRHITVGLMLFAVIFFTAAHPEPHQGQAQASDAGRCEHRALAHLLRTAISARSCCSAHSWPGPPPPAVEGGREAGALRSQPCDDDLTIAGHASFLPKLQPPREAGPA